MRKIILSLVLLMGFLKSLGQTLDNAAIRRIGDYGKLWTVLDLFHPQMAYGKIDRDSLYIDNIGDLLKDPTAANFKAAVQRLLGRMADPYTVINDTSTATDSIALGYRPALRWLPDSVALLHFDDAFMVESVDGYTITPLTKLLDSVRTAKSLVIDLRREKEVTDLNLQYYEPEFMKRLISFLSGKPVTYPAARTRIHYGHESQTQDMSAYYYQGWFLRNGSVVKESENALQKPVCLLVNQYNNNISDAVAALQNAGVATVVADGVLKKFASAPAYEMNLADSITVVVRTGEALYADGSNTLLPTAQILRSNATNDTLTNTAVRLLKENKKPGHTANEQLQNLFSSAPVARYDSLIYPPAPIRLLGLMRFWTAINYFCPNKERLAKNWDSVLYQYVPQFLAAKDSFGYHRTAARLIKEINDGHGFFYSTIYEPLRASVPEVQLKFIDGKTVVYKVFSDSLRKIVAPGDELISIDGKPVKALRDSLAQYIGASNNAALQRDINQQLLAGKAASSFGLQYRHNGILKTATLHRTVSRYKYFVESTTGQVWKKLNPKLGYVDLGRLETTQVDSMFSDFKETDAIILDDRNYPRGTAWTMISYLTTHDFGSPKFTTIVADSPEPLMQTRQDFQEKLHVSPKPQYSGKIIMLVNEITQSQAEYTCMMFQGASKNVTIIGSQTAGADGDVTGIKFPGGVSTAFSGHGVHYPDGRPTQGIGIVPDIKIKPTIAGIKAGKDEVLERAVQFAKTGK